MRKDSLWESGSVQTMAALDSGGGVAGRWGRVGRASVQEDSLSCCIATFRTLRHFPARRLSTRGSTPVSSKVHLPEAMNFRALCGANLAKLRSKFRPNKTGVLNCAGTTKQDCGDAVWVVCRRPCELREIYPQGDVMSPCPSWSRGHITDGRVVEGDLCNSQLLMPCFTRGFDSQWSRTLPALLL